MSETSELRLFPRGPAYLIAADDLGADWRGTVPKKYGEVVKAAIERFDAGEETLPPGSAASVSATVAQRDRIERWRKELVEWNEDPSDEYIREVNELCNAASIGASHDLAESERLRLDLVHRLAESAAEVNRLRLAAALAPASEQAEPVADSDALLHAIDRQAEFIGAEGHDVTANVLRQSASEIASLRWSLKVCLECVEALDEVNEYLSAEPAEPVQEAVAPIVGKLDAYAHPDNAERRRFMGHIGWMPVELADWLVLSAALRGIVTPRVEAEAMRELENIVNAKRFDRKMFRDDTEWADWAQSRARHTLSRMKREKDDA